MQPIERAAFANPDHWRSMFDELPLLIEGESKVIRVIDDQSVIVRLKPRCFRTPQIALPQLRAPTGYVYASASGFGGYSRLKVCLPRSFTLVKTITSAGELRHRLSRSS